MSLFLDKDSLTKFDASMEAQARARLDSLTKPQGSLGRIEDIAAWICGWQGTLKPRADKAYTLVFVGNHGVVAQGVSAYPPEVTAQMVANFENGGAAINQLCKVVPSTLRVIPLSLDKPTKDFTVEPAMTMAECEHDFRIGVDSVPKDADILVIGEMGIGNTTVAAAIAHAVCGGVAADWVGLGTGIDEKVIAKKREVVAQAVALHKNNLHDTIALLSHVGGRELAAMAGAIWQSRLQRVPVILDGYVVTAAAASLTLTAKDALAHCISGHLSVEAGHKKLLEFLDMKPLLDLGMRLGEGSGAQVALAVLSCAVSTFTGMATFSEAAVAGRNE